MLPPGYPSSSIYLPQPAYPEVKPNSSVILSSTQSQNNTSPQTIPASASVTNSATSTVVDTSSQFQIPYVSSPASATSNIFVGPIPPPSNSGSSSQAPDSSQSATNSSNSGSGESKIPNVGPIAPPSQLSQVGVFVTGSTSTSPVVSINFIKTENSVQQPTHYIVPSQSSPPPDPYVISNPIPTLSPTAGTPSFNIYPYPSLPPPTTTISPLPTLLPPNISVSSLFSVFIFGIIFSLSLVKVFVFLVRHVSS